MHFLRYLEKLLIQSGFYREKISIPRTLPFITFLGKFSDPPTLTGNDTASVTGADGKPLKTFQSATAAVDANYFVAINIKFEVNLRQLEYILYIYVFKTKDKWLNTRIPKLYLFQILGTFLLIVLKLVKLMVSV